MTTVTYMSTDVGQFVKSKPCQFSSVKLNSVRLHSCECTFRFGDR